MTRLFKGHIAMREMDGSDAAMAMQRRIIAMMRGQRRHCPLPASYMQGAIC
jgi:hypothetical protein